MVAFDKWITTKTIILLCCVDLMKRYDKTKCNYIMLYRSFISVYVCSNWFYEIEANDEIFHQSYIIRNHWNCFWHLYGCECKYLFVHFCSSANTPIKNNKPTPNRILVRTCDGLELRDPPYLPASPSPPRLTMQAHMNSSRTSLFGGGMGYGSAK